MRIGDLFAFVVVVLVMIVLSPVIVPLIIYTYFQQKFEKRRFDKFLKDHEGKRFFCYTARRTSVEYVKEHIVPFLPPDITIIYLGDSKNIYSMDGDMPFLQRLVGTMRMTKGGYPYVSKVLSGKLQTISVNDHLYNAIRRKVDATAINHKISRFLENEAAD